jgi:hypothetical protein
LLDIKFYFSGDARTRSKGVGALLRGEGLEAWKNAQCYKHFGRTGRIFSFRLKYEAMTSVQPSSYRAAQMHWFRRAVLPELMRRGA